MSGAIVSFEDANEKKGENARETQMKRREKMNMEKLFFFCVSFKQLLHIQCGLRKKRPLKDMKKP